MKLKKKIGLLKDEIKKNTKQYSSEKYFVGVATMI